MAAWRVPASALRRTQPAAAPPEPPPRDGTVFRRRRGVPLCSVAREDGGGPGPDSRGGPEEATKRPASQELTAAERRIAELHAAACALIKSRTRTKYPAIKEDTPKKQFVAHTKMLAS
ncbi:uncharacterized protein C1orf53 homolog isoform X2 [Bos javanicus]|uniref:uncharacterized protein C1orf53 homolog isoform X2 n=1 Tax=Bos javanicus TaxID=9906 RepID=UPI002AA64FC3|nr:uncharacterized protein C1orf53 homolog isoform X2 [Bos javanicus]